MTRKITTLCFVIIRAFEATGGVLQEGMVWPSSFDLINSRYNALHNLEANELTHRTGARVILLTPNVTTIEKTFAVSFRTPALDDSGVTHIIEHSVLSGSKRYPVRFPLHHFRKSSMATFVNAMTYPDRTTYPVATVDSQDLLNLASVYLDAVFDPLALESDTTLAREGWHLEFGANASEVKLSGIVYNEMKGVYSDPRTIGFSASMRTLLNGSTYQYVSGGLPAAIPSLTYPKFKVYYLKHYHPSNANFFYFGSLERVDELLTMIDSYLLLAESRSASNEQHNEFLRSSTAVGSANPINGPVYQDISIPTSEAEPKDSILITSLIGSTSLPVCERLALDLVSHLIIDNRETPLYKRIENSDIGTAILTYGVFNHGDPLLFGVGLEGIPQNWSSENSHLSSTFKSPAEYLDWIVTDELTRIINDGFDRKTVQAAINSFEFKIRDSATSQSNKGMALLDTILDEWNYDRDPIRGLDVDVALVCVKRRITEDPHYLVSLIERHLLNNRHRLIQTMHADKKYDKQRELNETVLVKEHLDMLGPDARLTEISKSRTLQDSESMPDSPEAVATLPRLPLNAVRLEPAHSDRAVIFVENVPVVTMNLTTAGISLFSLYIDLVDLTGTEMEQQPLLQYLVLHGDTHDFTASEVNRLIEEKTGGLDLSIAIHNNHASMMVAAENEATAWLEISFKCLSEDMAECVGLIADIMKSQDFHRNQAKTSLWLTEAISRRESDLLSDPSGYARKIFESRQTLSGKVVEMMEGVSSISALKSEAKEAQNNWTSLADSLSKAWTKIMRRERMAMRVTADTETLKVAISALHHWIATIPDSPRDSRRSFTSEGFLYETPRWTENIRMDKMTGDEAMLFSIPSMVAYNYLGGEIYPAGTPIQYKHLIPAKALSLDYIFPRIRFVGGAYGAGFRLKLSDGRYTFDSYRDPNTLETFKVMLASAEQMKAIAQNITDLAIEQHVIRAISQLDTPESNSGKSRAAFHEWAFRQTLEDKRKVRAELFGVTRKDFIDFAALLQTTLHTSPRLALSFAPADNALTSDSPPSLPAFRLQPLV